ncbi:hypothetical protein [Streptomyces sp. NPDC002619]|uniref:hypothetical protein n=1 Tax=Streptomyces sp. NPDC002619 TaxID=3364655 RepID=UPI0036D0B239
MESLARDRLLWLLVPKSSPVTPRIGDFSAPDTAPRRQSCHVDAVLGQRLVDVLAQLLALVGVVPGAAVVAAVIDLVEAQDDSLSTATRRTLPGREVRTGR